ncbi:hypothetical protein OAI04_03110 [Hyphomicrobiales bacterium]|nr:hypothetical protein [Hyphomicrobiales bacterium]
MGPLLALNAVQVMQNMAINSKLSDIVQLQDQSVSLQQDMVAILGRQERDRELDKIEKERLSRVKEVIFEINNDLDRCNKDTNFLSKFLRLMATESMMKQYNVSTSFVDSFTEKEYIHNIKITLEEELEKIFNTKDKNEMALISFMNKYSSFTNLSEKNESEEDFPVELVISLKNSLKKDSSKIGVNHKLMNLFSKEEQEKICKLMGKSYKEGHKWEDKTIVTIEDKRPVISSFIWIIVSFIIMSAITNEYYGGNINNWSTYILGTLMLIFGYELVGSRESEMKKISEIKYLFNNMIQREMERHDDLQEANKNTIRDLTGDINNELNDLSKHYPNINEYFQPVTSYRY